MDLRLWCLGLPQDGARILTKGIWRGKGLRLTRFKTRGKKGGSLWAIDELREGGMVPEERESQGGGKSKNTKQRRGEEINGAKDLVRPDLLLQSENTPNNKGALAKFRLLPNYRSSPAKKRKHPYKIQPKEY